MKKLVSTLNMEKSKWLRYRKRGIGGSDAGAVCSLNPYRSAIEVYQDKISEDIEDIDNEAMRQGRELDDKIIYMQMERIKELIEEYVQKHREDCGVINKDIIMNLSEMHLVG